MRLGRKVRLAGRAAGSAGRMAGLAGPKQPLLATDLVQGAVGEALGLADVLRFDGHDLQADQLACQFDAVRQLSSEPALGLRLTSAESAQLSEAPQMSEPPSDTQATIAQAVDLGVSYIWGNAAILSAWLSHPRSRPRSKMTAQINWVLCGHPSDLAGRASEFTKLAKDLKRLYIEYPVENLKDIPHPDSFTVGKAVDLRRDWPTAASGSASDPTPPAPDPATPASGPATPASDPATPTKIATAVWSMLWGAELLVCAGHDLPAMHQARQVCFRELPA